MLVAAGDDAVGDHLVAHDGTKAQDLADGTDHSHGSDRVHRMGDDGFVIGNGFNIGLPDVFCCQDGDGAFTKESRPDFLFAKEQRGDQIHSTEDAEEGRHQLDILHSSFLTEDDTAEHAGDGTEEDQNACHQGTVKMSGNQNHGKRVGFHRIFCFHMSASLLTVRHLPPGKVHRLLR